MTDSIRNCIYLFCCSRKIQMYFASQLQIEFCTQTSDIVKVMGRSLLRQEPLGNSNSGSEINMIKKLVKYKIKNTMMCV